MPGRNDGDTIGTRWRLNRKRNVDAEGWGLAVWQIDVVNQHGDVVATDNSDLSAGTWCYIVRIQLADRDYEPALVQVDVPAPTPVVPPAATP